MPEIRIYPIDGCVRFRRTNEVFGGLSNMAPGFPIVVNDTTFRSSEALYQACRYPHLPDIQRMIIEEKSPMTAKMKTRSFRTQSRSDWNRVRVRIMRWCLRAKLAQNWERFSALLLSSKHAPIVEDSTKDTFWGARADESGHLVGKNVLGRLLMELRDEIRTTPEDGLKIAHPPELTSFLLLGKPIETVTEIVRGGRNFDLFLAHSSQSSS